jgi:hypothetical protein
MQNEGKERYILEKILGWNTNYFHQIGHTKMRGIGQSNRKRQNEGGELMRNGKKLDGNPHFPSQKFVCKVWFSPLNLA